MKLLVPVDGSEPALRAVMQAVAIAKGARRSEILLITVQNPVGPELGELGMLDPLLAQEAARRSGERALRKAIARVRAAKLRFRCKIESGPIAPAIAKIARQEEIDQIVMGTRGLGGVRGLLLGSVTTQLVHLATVPVTLVK
jgi:nucleotide-binding universal stress UspA family protein